jgi:hypothetical protein
MEIQEVLLRAMGGQISWVQAAESIRVSDRRTRRWRERLEHEGCDGRFNRRFAVAPAQAGIAFLPTTVDLDRIFSIHDDRVVDHDNTVRMGRRHLQIEASPLRCHVVRCRVTVREHVGGTWNISHAPTS